MTWKITSWAFYAVSVKIYVATCSQWPALTKNISGCCQENEADKRELDESCKQHASQPSYFKSCLFSTHLVSVAPHGTQQVPVVVVSCQFRKMHWSKCNSDAAVGYFCIALHGWSKRQPLEHYFCVLQIEPTTSKKKPVGICFLNQHQCRRDAFCSKSLLCVFRSLYMFDLVAALAYLWLLSGQSTSYYDRQWRQSTRVVGRPETGGGSGEKRWFEQDPSEEEAFKTNMNTLKPSFSAVVLCLMGIFSYQDISKHRFFFWVWHRAMTSDEPRQRIHRSALLDACARGPWDMSMGTTRRLWLYTNIS